MCMGLRVGCEGTEQKECPRAPGGRRESFSVKQMLGLSETGVLSGPAEQTGGRQMLETWGEREAGMGPVGVWELQRLRPTAFDSSLEALLRNDRV